MTDLVQQMAAELEARQPIGLTVATVISHQVAAGLREDPDDTPEQHLFRALHALRAVGRAMMFVAGDAVVEEALIERGVIDELEPGDR